MSDKQTAPTVAVWWSRGGSTDFTLCESPEDAYAYAYATTDSGEGYVVGFQYADGSHATADDDPGYLSYETARYAAELAAFRQRAASEPPRETITVVSPFDGSKLKVTGPVPDWVGRLPEHSN